MKLIKHLIAFHCLKVLAAVALLIHTQLLLQQNPCSALLNKACNGIGMAMMEDGQLAHVSQK